MPTYAYACTACDNRFEVQQSFTDDSLTDCPDCAGRVRKLFNSVGIVFKGSGFYRNDSRAGADNGASAGDKADKGGSEKSSPDKGSSDKGSSDKGSPDKGSPDKGGSDKGTSDKASNGKSANGTKGTSAKGGDTSGGSKGGSGSKGSSTPAPART